MMRAKKSVGRSFGHPDRIGSQDDGVGEVAVQQSQRRRRSFAYPNRIGSGWRQGTDQTRRVGER